MSWRTRLERMERRRGVHTHRAMHGAQRSVAFAGCVTPNNCHEGAHGNVTLIDTCKCGMTRSVNINQHHSEVGPWRRV